MCEFSQSFTLRFNNNRIKTREKRKYYTARTFALPCVRVMFCTASLNYYAKTDDIICSKINKHADDSTMLSASMDSVKDKINYMTLS